MNARISALIPAFGRLTDVTLPLQPGMPVWPGDPNVEMERVASIPNGDPCNVSQYRFGSHTGTHVDPPLHFYESGAPLHEMPLDAGLGPCFVADLTGVGGSISPSDLERAGIPADAERILLKTANSRLWNAPLHPFRPDFVDVSPDGARWLAGRGVRLVGIDYLSIERPDDPACPVHRILLAVPILILEGLDLREAAPGWHRLICLPLKAMNGDGAPARVILADSA